MSFFLALSKWIDAINEKIGLAVGWALMAAVLICSGNAIIRYAFNRSSNAWLEIQWYLFSLMFLMAAAYTLRRNEHVRIDVIVSRLSQRAQVWVDIFGLVFFLMPMTLLTLYYAVPFAALSFQNEELSSNSGGLILWPAKMMIPVGFALLALQGVSELIKRFGFLAGRVDASAFQKQATTPEEEIEAIKSANKLN